MDNYQGVLKNEITRLDKHEFDKKLTLEREVEKLIDLAPPSNIQFDETNQFIFYPSILGIKLVELNTNKLIKILGKNENERFLTSSLFQGKALRVL